MKSLDRIIQQWRIRRALPHLPKDARVLDVGSDDGKLLQLLGRSQNVGIDPNIEATHQESFGTLIRGEFPAGLQETDVFQAMTALAVLEHIPAAQQRAFAHACAEHLTEGGTLVITVFSPRVDAVLAVLRILRLVDGMSLEQHYGYRVEDTVPLFTSAGFALKLHQRFQSRLNNLCVFSKELA